MAANPPSIRSGLRKIYPYLIQAREQNLNEADTVARVVKVFEDVLGYDTMTEISHESVIKGKYADIAIKLDEATRLLVEVKAAGGSLRDRHTDQAKAYAAEGNIRWVVLTNGIEWKLYHLSFEEGIESDLVFSVDLSCQELDEAGEMLALLHRESVRKGFHDELWQRKSALSPQSIAKALFTEGILRRIRRDIKKSEGVSIGEEDLVSAIKGLLSLEAREQIGPIKIKKVKRPGRKKLEQEAAAPPQTVQPEQQPQAPSSMAPESDTTSTPKQPQ